MPFVRVRLTDGICRALDSLVGAGGRAEFIRTAIQKAIREAEYAHVRAAYIAQPDSESEADDWSNCEEFKA
jgi:metal-responsive CopG/Arc/MetJ family transcriptional regulator